MLVSLYLDNTTGKMLKIFTKAVFESRRVTVSPPYPGNSSLSHSICLFFCLSAWVFSGSRTVVGSGGGLRNKNMAVTNYSIFHIG